MKGTDVHALEGKEGPTCIHRTQRRGFERGKEGKGKVSFNFFELRFKLA